MWSGAKGLFLVPETLGIADFKVLFPGRNTDTKRHLHVALSWPQSLAWASGTARVLGQTGERTAVGLAGTIGLVVGGTRQLLQGQGAWLSSSDSLGIPLKVQAVATKGCGFFPCRTHGS
jgi:hypothetical protein